jgi:hypothetical protein
MINVWLILAGASVLLAAWALGYAAGQRTRRQRTQASTVRDAVAGYQAMGYDREAAQKLCREAGAAALRKAGVWDS